MSMRGRISSTASAGSSSATCGGLLTGNQSVATIVVRNALSTSASRRPLRPRPMMPIRAPCRSRVGRRMNSCFCWARKYVGRLRSKPGEKGHACGRRPGWRARPTRW